MPKRKSKSSDVVRRVSVSIKTEDYAELKDIAEDKRVSVAWVVRDAVADYLTARTPLLRRRGKDGNL